MLQSSIILVYSIYCKLLVMLPAQCTAQWLLLRGWKLIRCH